MNDLLLDFLIQKYGNRVDKKQTLDSLDTQTIAEQLKLVESQIGNARMIGILYLIIALLWLIIGCYSLFKSTVDFFSIGKVILSIAFILLGFSHFFQGAEMKRKKVILETILFVNKGNS